MKRADGAYMTQSEMAETIERQAETIRVQRIEIDNLHERIRAFEAQFEPVDMPSQLDPARRAYLNGHDDEYEIYSQGLPK